MDAATRTQNSSAARIDAHDGASLIDARLPAAGMAATLTVPTRGCPTVTPGLFPERRGTAMNYRHAFHAGNFADVFKHTVLIALLDALKAKPTPFCYVDTHAGRGDYDLHGSEATRTGEAGDGIKRLANADTLPPLLDEYVALVRSCNTGPELLRYPGSPQIARLRMREIDRAVLCEVQDDEAAALKALLRDDARFAVHQRDGYAALKAFLPPKERRGLVLIDPPFEAQEQEFRLIEAALDEGRRRWPTGIYAVWYPIKLREHIVPFHRWLAGSGFDKVLAAELLLHPDNSGLRLNGCGMAIVNAPWRLDETLREAMTVLGERLAQSRYGQTRLEWLVRE